VEPAFAQPTFKEFVIRLGGRDVPALVDAAADEGILAGVPLGRWYPRWHDCLLIAVTEKRTKSQIDRLVEVVGSS